MTGKLQDCTYDLKRLVETSLAGVLKKNKSLKKTLVTLCKDQEEVSFVPGAGAIVRLRPHDYQVTAALYDAIRLGNIVPPKGYTQPELDAKFIREKELKQQKIDAELERKREQAQIILEKNLLKQKRAEKFKKIAYESSFISESEIATVASQSEEKDESTAVVKQLFGNSPIEDCSTTSTGGSPAVSSRGAQDSGGCTGFREASPIPNNDVQFREGSPIAKQLLLQAKTSTNAG